MRSSDKAASLGDFMGKDLGVEHEHRSSGLMKTPAQSGEASVVQELTRDVAEREKTAQIAHSAALAAKATGKEKTLQQHCAALPAQSPRSPGRLETQSPRSPGRLETQSPRSPGRPSLASAPGGIVGQKRQARFWSSMQCR